MASDETKSATWTDETTMPASSLFRNHKRLMGKTDWYLDYYEIRDPTQLFEASEGLAYLDHPLIEGTNSVINRKVGIFSDVATGYQISKQSTWRAPARRLVPALRRLLDGTNDFFDEDFNMVLFNEYGDGLDSIAPHYDNPKGNGLHCVVTVSLGGTREYTLTCRETNKVVAVFEMKHGHVLVMSNRFQDLFLHSIPKTDRPCTKRISLTMRRLLEEEGAPPTTGPMATFAKKRTWLPNLGLDKNEALCLACKRHTTNKNKVCDSCFPKNLFTCPQCSAPYGAPWLCKDCWVKESQQRKNARSTTGPPEKLFHKKPRLQTDG